MNLLIAYVEHADLVRAMAEIVREELDHFQLVLDLLHRRNIPFRRLNASGYGRELNKLVRKEEPARAVDRLLVAALIEARSCERFALLRDHLHDKELATFYGSLFESEARHHATYVRLASLFSQESIVLARLDELAAVEANILVRGEPEARMHS